jgi:hypothetical protein
MQRKIMIHLSHPTRGIEAIKFIDLKEGKTGVTMKGVLLQMKIMSGINNIWLVRGGRTQSAVQQLVDNRLEGVKLVHEFGIHGVKFVLDLGIKLCKVGMGRENLICHMLDGFMGLIYGSLQDLVASGGHLDMGSVGKGKWVGGTTEKEL